MNVSDFLELKDINVLLDDEVFCDGKVLALYSEEKENYTSAIEEKMKAASCNKLIVVYSHKKMEIQRQLQEYEVLQEIKTDTIFFANEENKVLEKEIPIIEEDLSKEIEAYLEYAFGENSGKKVFYFEGDKLRSTNKKRVTDIVDLVCEEVYYATVSVNNELINKQNISTAPIKKARKTIMETLINGEDTEVYMSGTSAESTIYRALFVGTGIRNGQYAHNVERVIDIFNDFIASACDCKKCMSNLLDVLTKEPIGMRKGIIPIYLAYVLSERNEDVVIYFGKKEQQLTSDILLNMCEYPEDYYIFVSSDDVRKEQYLSAMGQLFDAKETTNKSESRIAGILLAMQRWFRALPQVTKNIKKNNVYWNNDAIAQAFPKIKILLQSMDANPYEVIFVELPKVVGSDDYSDICNILAELRQKANNYLSWISQRAVEKTIETFDKKAKQDLHHTMIEWYEHQSDFAKHGLHSSQVTGLMTCIAENSSYDDVEFVKRIIRAVTDIHLDTWNEASLEEYISMLKAVQALFSRKEIKMACRKDGKGRVLRKGEGYRKGDGRYSYVYIDPLGKKRTIYAKSLVKLREREEQLQRDQLDGLDVYVAGKADVNFLFDRYISTKTELRSTTYSNYLYTWNHFIRDTFGKKKIKDVKYSDVLFFYTDLITNQGLQINTLETINTVLRPTFQLAVRDDIIRKNPVDGAYCEVKKRNGGSRKTRRALTVDQQRKFMEYVAKNPFFYHWYPFFVFLLGTGCRIGEAIGIRWDDIDMENRVIDINHSLTYYQRADDSYKCEFRVSLPKTEAGNRRIPMMQQVYEVLKEEYDRQTQEGFCIENVDGMTNFVFTNRFGMPHNPAAVNRAIKRIVDAHNSEEEVAAKKKKREPVMIPRFSCHIFRHTFASRFCENETNIKVIQEVMGHADVSTTMNIYAEANPEVTRTVIENLSKNMDIF